MNLELRSLNRRPFTPNQLGLPDNAVAVDVRIDAIIPDTTHDSKVCGLWFRISGFGFRVSGFGFRVSGLGFRA